MSTAGALMETESGLVGTWGGGERGETEVTTNGYGVSFLDGKSVLKRIVGIVAHICEYTEN